MIHVPSRRPSFVVACLMLAAASLLVVGGGYGLYRWQGWRVPYAHFEVGGEAVNPAAFKALNQLRVRSKRRWWVVSGYRSAEHNADVGGEKSSQHIKGRAFDVVVSHVERAAFYEAAKEVGFKGFGWGDNTVHVDTGSRRWWTYDDKGDAARGAKRYSYLHKAPPNFQGDFKIKPR